MCTSKVVMTITHYTVRTLSSSLQLHVHPSTNINVASSVASACPTDVYHTQASNADANGTGIYMIVDSRYTYHPQASNADANGTGI